MGASQSSPTSPPPPPTPSSSPSPPSPPASSSSSSSSSTSSSFLSPTPLVVPRSSHDVVDVSASSIPKLSASLPTPTAPKPFSDFSLVSSNRGAAPLPDITNSATPDQVQNEQSFVVQVINETTRIIQPKQSFHTAFENAPIPTSEVEEAAIDEIRMARARCIADRHTSLEGSKIELVACVFGGTFSILAPSKWRPVARWSPFLVSGILGIIADDILSRVHCNNAHPFPVFPKSDVNRADAVAQILKTAAALEKEQNTPAGPELPPSRK